MSLSCFCEYDPDPGSIVWEMYREYGPLKRRATWCCSCKERIPVGSVVVEVLRFKIPDNDIEKKIYGEDGEIPRASRYLCERCGDLAYSLEDLGFCQSPWEDQRELVKEYAAMQRESK